MAEPTRSKQSGTNVLHLRLPRRKRNARRQGPILALDLTAKSCAWPKPCRAETASR